MISKKELAQPVLVTGATGFIGQVLVDKLLEQDNKVSALVLPQEEIPVSWGDRVEIIRGSIIDPEAVQTSMKGAGTVFHLAAVVGDWGDEKLFWETGVDGTRHILDEALKYKTRTVLASSIVVYGENIGKCECTEDVSFGKILGPYSRVKQAQEKMAWEYHKEKELPLTVIRPANVYGPGSKPWVHQVLYTLRQGGPTLINGGDFNAGLVYVDTVAEAMIIAASSPKAIGRAYNVCDENDITWKRYLSDLSEIVGLPKPKAIPGFLAKPAGVAINTVWKTFNIKKQPPMTRESLNLVGSRHRINVDRLKNDLKYKPDYPYEKGLAEVKKYVLKEKL